MNSYLTGVTRNTGEGGVVGGGVEERRKTEGGKRKVGNRTKEGMVQNTGERRERERSKTKG